VRTHGHACGQARPRSAPDRSGEDLPKIQLTLPEEIQRTLHIGKGDEVESAVHDDETDTLRGYVSIPHRPDLVLHPRLASRGTGSRSSDCLRVGTGHGSAQDMFTYLGSLSSTDE
jgi:hypothetical protein